MYEILMNQIIVIEYKN